MYKTVARALSSPPLVYILDRIDIVEKRLLKVFEMIQGLLKSASAENCFTGSQFSSGSCPTG